MTIPHLDLQIQYLTAIKAGKRMEWRCRSEQHEFVPVWTSSEEDNPLWLPYVIYQIREVKRQQYIPECDVPRALEVRPEIGAKYWTIDLDDGDCVVEWRWADDCYDAARFAAGLCFATEADAHAAWNAMTARRDRK